MARASFQLRLFLAAGAAAVLALLIASGLIAWSLARQNRGRVDRTLAAHARLAAALLEASAPGTAAGDREAIDREADRIGALIDAHVTLVAPDGRVVGDSAEPFDALAALESHGADMLYTAAAVSRPDIAAVRIALPRPDVSVERRAILEATLAALGVALIGSSVLAFVMTRRIRARVRAFAAVAARYRDGNLTPGRVDYGDDELGVVARALDEAVQQLAARVAGLGRDRGRMAAILGGMVEGVIVVDSQGRLQLANDAARQMLKLDDLALGRHYVETIRHPAVTDLVTAALAGASPTSVQLSPPRDASKTIVARAAVTATAGDLHGAVLVLHDITDLRRADQIRRDFVANVSHELRTPLTAIRGYVEALEEGDADREEQRRFLEIIRRHTLRMERLVKDLLRLARLDAGQEPLELVACDTQSVVQAVVKEVTESASARRQHIDIHLEPGAESMRADPAKLHDVLRNLIANASAYTPEDTTIVVSARRHDGATVIDVADQGPGIPEGDLTRVFERFYRVDRSRARDPGGTGLGLSIVKHLVELHGGTVHVTNRPQGGALFTLTIPCEPITGNPPGGREL